MTKQKTKIDPDKMYGLTEIFKAHYVPGIKSYNTLLKRVLEDEALPQNQKTINLIKAGEGRGRKYFILGRNLLRFIERQAK